MIVILVIVVVIVVVVVQQLKMAVISATNLRNAISLIRKSDNLTTISGNINSLCLLSNSRTTISVYSPIKQDAKRNGRLIYLVRVEPCIVDSVQSVCDLIKRAIHIYLHTQFFHHIVL